VNDFWIDSTNGSFEKHALEENRRIWTFVFEEESVAQAAKEEDFPPAWATVSAPCDRSS
jgi:hypothetical protein